MSKDVTQKKKILLVCAGGSCRSPMALAILKMALGPEAENYIFSSAGTSGATKVSDQAKDVVKKLGGQIQDESVNALSAKMINDADIVLCLGNNVVDRVLKLAPDSRDKVFRYGPDRDRVPDPYDGQGLEQSEVDEIWQLINPKRNIEWSSDYERRSQIRGLDLVYDYVAKMMLKEFNPKAIEVIRSFFKVKEGNGISPKEVSLLQKHSIALAKL